MRRWRMDSQILLNVNFCSEVHTNLIEKNEKSVYVRRVPSGGRGDPADRRPDSGRRGTDGAAELVCSL